MKKVLLLIGAALALVCISDLAFGQFGKPFGKPGPYENYESGYAEFSAGDSLIIPADTDCQVTYISVLRTGSPGDTLTMRLLQRYPNQAVGSTAVGGWASTDELYVAVCSAGKVQYELPASCDTLILRGEAADATEWSYFVGQSYMGPDSKYGSAP